jgi:hypothetical protein
MSAPPWRVALAALLLVVLAAAVTAEPEARRTYLVLATAQDRGTDLSDALLDLSKDLRAQGRDDLQQEAARRRLWLIIRIVLILAPMCRLGLDPVGRSVERSVDGEGWCGTYQTYRWSCRGESQGVPLRLGLRRGSSCQCVEAVRCW